MQVVLAVVATVGGIGAWFRGASPIWLLGALLIFTVVPFTLLVIRPINNQLLDPAIDRTSRIEFAVFCGAGEGFTGFAAFSGWHPPSYSSPPLYGCNLCRKSSLAPMGREGTSVAVTRTEKHSYSAIIDLCPSDLVRSTLRRQGRVMR